MAEQSVLQVAARMICGCLADLPRDDQARALEEASVALGLRVFVAQSDPGPFGLLAIATPSPCPASSSPDPVPPYQEAPPLVDLMDRAPRGPLPMVHVEMRGDRPMVMNRSMARRARPAMAVMDAQGRLSQRLLVDRGANRSAIAEPTRHGSRLPRQR